MLKFSKLAMLVFALLNTSAFAQSIYDQSSPTTKPNPTVMSPNEFKSAINQLSQQSTNNLKDQAKQLFTKTPTNKADGTSNTADSANQQASSSVTSTSPQPEASSDKPSEQSNTYTGFSNGSSGSSSGASKKAPASSGNTGGWNINY